jgi:hypothetical protein
MEPAMPLEHSPARQRHDHPHLTREELAERWRLEDPNTLSRVYRKLGLRPIKIGKRLLFLITEIEEVERRRAQVSGARAAQ